jgi:hypothetical protein
MPVAMLAQSLASPVRVWGRWYNPQRRRARGVGVAWVRWAAQENGLGSAGRSRLGEGARWPREGCLKGFVLTHGSAWS